MNLSPFDPVQCRFPKEDSLFQLEKLRLLVPAFLTAVIGLGISFFAFDMASQNETKRLSLEMERRVENHMRAIETGIVARIRLVEEMRGLLMTGNQMSRDDFRMAIKQIDLDWSNLEVLVWLPPIMPDSNPDTLSPGARDIPEMENMIARPNVVFCDLDIDCGDAEFLSTPGWQAALKRAQNRKITTGISFSWRTPGETAFMGVVVPHWQLPAAQEGAQDSQGRLHVGYLIGVFHTADMVENIVGQQTAPSGLDVYMYEGDSSLAGRQIHFHPSRSRSVVQEPLQTAALKKTSHYLWRLRTLDIEWTFAFLPVPSVLSQLRANEAVWILLFGILTTVLLSGYFLLSVRRAGQIRAVIRQRTRALRRTNLALERQASLVAFLQGVAAQANEATRVEDALEKGLEDVCQFTGFPIGHAYAVVDGKCLQSTGIWWSDGEEDMARLHEATSITRLHRREGLVGRAWEIGRPLWSNAVHTEMGGGRNTAAQDTGIRTAIAVPILSGPDVAIVLEFLSCESIDEDPALIEALKFVSSQLGRVLERAVTAEKLRAAVDQAENANAAKSKFLAAASHDLRQPLQAMNLFVNVLKAKDKQPDDGEIIGHLQESVASLDELLNALLNISKLEAGLVVPEVATFGLAGLFQRLDVEYRPLFEKKGLRFRLVTPSLSVRSDPVLVERILRNFLSNALRYTDTGGVVLGSRRTGDALRVGVWDTGNGIDEKHLEAIFQEFYQVPKTGEEEEEGVGLGLAIVKKLGVLLGHRIAVDSAPGRGSAFSVVVPLGEAEDVPETATDAIPAGAMPSGLYGKIVMIIDDEEKVRIAMRYQLESWGSRVMAVGSIDEAIAALDTGNPDLIVADYRLQMGASGQKAIMAVRKKAGKHIPALLFSGDTAPKRLLKAEKSGLKLLHKPVSPAILLNALQAELQGST